MLSFGGSSSGGSPAPTCQQLLELLGFPVGLFNLQLCCCALALPHFTSIFSWQPLLLGPLGITCSPCSSHMPLSTGSCVLRKPFDVPPVGWKPGLLCSWGELGCSIHGPHRDVKQWRSCLCWNCMLKGEIALEKKDYEEYTFHAGLSSIKFFIIIWVEKAGEKFNW